MTGRMVPVRTLLLIIACIALATTLILMATTPAGTPTPPTTSVAP